jgi:hypothetical protein
MYINKGPFKADLKTKFSKVFRNNLFFGLESRSGAGSDLTQTREIARHLPGLLKDLKVRSLLDLPCGDFNWMSNLDLHAVNYIGADLVPELINDLNESYGDNARKFITLNIVNEVPPQTDAVFCRDLLVHLNNSEVASAISNFRKSGAEYLFTTTFPLRVKNFDLPLISREVAWRPINLELPPFNFPEPIHILNEACTEGGGSFSDKSIGVWKIQDL